MTHFNKKLYLASAKHFELNSSIFKALKIFLNFLPKLFFYKFWEISNDLSNWISCLTTLCMHTQKMSVYFYELCSCKCNVSWKKQPISTSKSCTFLRKNSWIMNGFMFLYKLQRCNMVLHFLFKSWMRHP